MGCDPIINGVPGGSSVVGLAFDLQRQWFEVEHFTGWAPDGNKSGNLSFAELVAGGGVSDAQPNAYPVDAMGAGTLQIPARAAPVAPDAAVFAAWRPQVQANDLVGMMLATFRIRIDVLPVAGQDHMVFVGIANDEVNFAEPLDGWYLFLDLNSANWILKSARAGVRAVLDTGFAAVAGAWQTLMVCANATTGDVIGYGANNGNVLTSIGTVTPANIQPSTTIQTISALSNQGNITGAVVNAAVDYIGHGGEYGVLR